MDLSDITVIVSLKHGTTHLRSFLASLPPSIKLIVVDVRGEHAARQVMALRPDNTVVIRYQGRIHEARSFASVQARTRWLLFARPDAPLTPETFTHLAQNKARGAFFGPRPSNGFNWQNVLARAGIPLTSGANLLVERYVFHEAGGFERRAPANAEPQIGFNILRAGFRIRYAHWLRADALPDPAPRSTAPRPRLADSEPGG